jgi:metallo-beta-lactamase class B
MIIPPVYFDKHRIILLQIFLLLVAAFPSIAQEKQSAEDELKSWTEPVGPAKIIGPLYYVGTKGLAVYLINTGEGLILVNGAMPKAASIVEANIRKLGFRPEDIKIMLTCHGHIDHVGTHAYFKKLSGAQVAMMAEDVDLLESGGKTDFHYGHIPAFLFEPVKVDRVLRDGDEVTLGNITLTAMHTPGHTKGGTSWKMNIIEGGKVYKIFFPDGTSINPGYRLEKNPSYPGIADDYRRTLHTWEMQRPDIWLPSHASFFGYEQRLARVPKEGLNAWVDPHGYRQYSISRREIFEKTIDAELSGIDINGSKWQLVQFKGADGKVLTPSDKSAYAIEFGTDGQAKVKVDCNTGNATWKLGGWMQIVLGPLAFTRKACPPQPITDKFSRDWNNVRSYAITDNHLFLTIQSDGGVYEFELVGGK